LEYVQKVSFVFDMRIVMKTILLLLSFKKDTSLVEKKFTG
jgi:lipopolysaccharide/colanic/teichoic acid biosynthesis glycosyltransferase